MDREEIVEIIENQNNLVLSQQGIFDITDETRLELHQHQDFVTRQNESVVIEDHQIEETTVIDTTPSVMEIHCSPSPHTVPEMITNTQEVTTNEEVVLIFDDVGISDETYNRIQEVTSLPETIQYTNPTSTTETELQVVPGNTFPSHVTSPDGQQLVVLPMDAQQVPVFTTEDDTSNQVTWQSVDDVINKDDPSNTERVMAFDSRTGELVDIENLQNEDGHVTYIVHEENEEEGTSYRILTDEQLSQIQEPETTYEVVQQSKENNHIEEKISEVTYIETPEQDMQTEEPPELQVDNKHTPQVIDLGTAMPLISPDNMQALLQILQAFPVGSEGQTLQVVLQGNSEEQQIFQLADAGIHGGQMATATENEVVHLVQMVEGTGQNIPIIKRPTIDTAVQATPEQSDKNNLEPWRKLPYIPKRRTLKKNPSRTTPAQNLSYVSDWEDSTFAGEGYYAVTDCPSEDGYSTGQEVTTGVEVPKSDFMEDHLELQSEGKSLLSSTLDESTVESPFQRKNTGGGISGVRPVGTLIDLPESVTNFTNVTLTAKTYEQVKMEGKNLAEVSYDESDPLSRPPRYTRGMRTLPRRTIHRCGHCEYESRDKLMVAQHCRSEHEGESVRILTLVPECSRRQCPYCKKWFNYAEFFQHMRFSHNDVHPFKCFYCDFQGRDRNQVKHHICKKHGKPPRIINLMREAEGAESRKKTMSEGEESIYEYVTEDEDEEIWEDGMDRKTLACPECKKTFKSLKYLKTHIKMHRPNRFQCGYCDYIATLEHQILKHSLRKHGTAEPRVVSKEIGPEKNPLISRDIDSVVRHVFSMSLRQPKDDDPMTWARKWTCPHCDYTCQFGASFRRHIRMHANLLPYKCNYCSFKGREKYYVRRHIARMHRGLPEIVVENTAENRAGDTSSDEDYQEKGLRRRRKRRVKNVLKAVVPVATPTPPNVHIVVKKETGNASEEEMDYEKMENGMEKGSFGCVYCDFSAADRSKVRVHVLSEHPSMPFCVVEDVKENVRTFPCPICQQLLIVGDEDGLREHFYIHYDYKPFACSLCHLTAHSKEMLQAHGTMEHGGEIEIVPAKDEFPPDGLEETILQFLRQDVEVTPPEVDENESVHQQEQHQQIRPIKPIRTTSRRFECPICRCTTNRHAATVRRHLYSHFDFKPYVCDYCGFRTFSDNDVRQHIATSHGKVLPKVSISDERTPPELEALLTSVNEQLSNGNSKFPAASDPTSLVTEEGKRWHDILARGVCPWCEEFVGHFRPTAYRHLKTHFQCKPYRCGHCTYQGSERNEIKSHSLLTHPNDDVSVVGPSIKMAEIEEGLRRYLQSHPQVLERTRIGGVESESAVIQLENETKTPEQAADLPTVEKLGKTTANETVKNTIEVPVELLEDVCYLLQLSCLPQDIPLTRRKLVWHRCERCKQKFLKASSLREHVMTEHPAEVTTYLCCYCNYWNLNKSFVRNHIQSTHPGRRVLVKEKLYERKEESVEEVVVGGKKSRVEDNSLTLVETTVGELPAKRKRGRPSKLGSELFTDGETKEINVVVRVDGKRGRQRRAASGELVEGIDEREVDFSDLEECNENLPKVLHVLTLP